MSEEHDNYNDDLVSNQCSGEERPMKMKLLPHVEGNSIRNAILTDGEIAILQKISIDKVKKWNIHS